MTTTTTRETVRLDLADRLELAAATLHDQLAATGVLTENDVVDAAASWTTSDVKARSRLDFDQLVAGLLERTAPQPDELEAV